MAFDLDGHMRAVGVDGHDVHRADCGRVFTAHELGALPYALDLFGEIPLQVVFHAIFAQSRIGSQIVRLVAVDVLRVTSSTSFVFVDCTRMIFSGVGVAGSSSASCGVMSLIVHGTASS